jgi:hypothetical protein
MKRNLLRLACGLACLAVGLNAYAKDFSLTVGAIPSVSDVANANGSSSKMNTTFTVDPFADFAYGLKLSDSLTLKLGLYAEDYFTFSDPMVYAGKAEPYAEISPVKGLTIRSSFPLMFYTASASGYTALKSAYKGYGDDKITDYTGFIVGNYEKIAYKLSLSDAFALGFGAEVDMGLVPFLFNDVKPVISLYAGPVQADAKASIYVVSAATVGSNGKSAYGTFDPKLTFDFGSVGVKNLKVFCGANIPVLSLSDSYKGINVTPGLSYKIGGFGLEGNFKLSNVDMSKDNGDSKNSTFDPSLKLSYSFSF